MDAFDGIVLDPKIVDRFIREVHNADQPNSTKLRQCSKVADRFICKRGVLIFEDTEEVEEGIWAGEVRFEPEEFDGAFAPSGRYEET